jgi:hypothetical protein
VPVRLANGALYLRQLCGEFAVSSRRAHCAAVSRVSLRGPTPPSCRRGCRRLHPMFLVRPPAGPSLLLSLLSHQFL